MNSQAECEQFDTKQENVLVPIIEIKTELLDVSDEIKAEEEEYDINHETSLFPHHISDVERTHEDLDERLEDSRMKSHDEQKNIEDNVMPIVRDPFESYGTSLREEEYRIYVYDHTEEKTVCNNRTQTPDKRFKCDVCNKCFPSNSKFIRHMYVHTGETPFMCNICGKSFSQKSNLTKHTYSHTNLKPFTCNVCGKSYSHKCNLTKHALMHTQEKPFTCSFCSKSFYQKSHLILHIRTHTKEKPYTCNICGSSFSDKSNLSQHTRIHTNEKPFRCTICNKSFSQKSSCSRHTQTHRVDDS